MRIYKHKITKNLYTVEIVDFDIIFCVYAYAYQCNAETIYHSCTQLLDCERYLVENFDIYLQTI